VPEADLEHLPPQDDLLKISANTCADRPKQPDFKLIQREKQSAPGILVLMLVGQSVDT
jgi:hypothetical protein